MCYNISGIENKFQGGDQMKILGALTIGIAIIATIIGLFNPAEAITIIVYAIVVELFVGVLLAAAHIRR